MLDGLTVAISGASGSFGRAFIRTLLADPAGPARIIGLSRNADRRYALEALCPDSRLEVVPCDIRQPADLGAALQGQIDVLVMAAAEKHIGTGQRFSAYTWSTNATGTVNTLGRALDLGIPRVLFLSTDKACEPINEYGRSKAAAERIVLQSSSRGTKCSCVRYGNVAGSSGSVIPLFYRQRADGRLTITDRRMTRFFMPIADPPLCDLELYEEPGRRPVMSAVRWVLYALEHMKGGEIFIPRIPSGSIADLAAQIGPDCVIEEIGIRDAEKLHEDLIGPSDLAEFLCYALPGEVGWTLTSTFDGQAGWMKPPFVYRSDLDAQPIRLGREALCASQ